MESLNDSTLAGGEGQGSRGETFHPIYRECPVSSMAEHPLLLAATDPVHIWSSVVVATNCLVTKSDDLCTTCDNSTCAHLD
jgi:hypothetical protein